MQGSAQEQNADKKKTAEINLIRPLLSAIF